MIKFVPAVVIGNEDPDEIPAPNVVLLITPPLSRIHAAAQTLNIPVRVQVPTDGLLKLRLLPSKQYQPFGVYKVSIHKDNARLPIEEMQWTIPDPPVPKTIQISSSGTGEDFVNAAMYSIQGVSRSGDYTYVNGTTIKWLSNIPAAGEPYTVTYMPALTIDDLVVKEGPKHPPITRLLDPAIDNPIIAATIFY
jgi:hypothetical protein